MHKKRDLAVFFYQLGTLLQSGVPIHLALEAISQNIRPRSLAELAQALEANISGGSNLSQSMAKFSSFTPTMRQLIEVGERTGNIDTMCLEIHKTLTWELELEKKILLKSIYPIFLLCSTLFIIPLPELIMGNCNPNHYFSQNLYPLASILLVFLTLKNNQTFTTTLKNTASHLPIIGSTLKTIELTRFCLILASTEKAGIQTPAGVKIAFGSLTLTPLKNKLESAQRNIEQGESLSQTLASKKLLPWNLATTLAIGEKSGKLDNTLQTISEELAKKTLHSVQRTLILLGPLLLLFAGGFMALKIFSFYSQYFQQLAQ
jgi:type II secretory pathway component PulF